VIENAMFLDEAEAAVGSDGRSEDGEEPVDDPDPDPDPEEGYDAEFVDSAREDTGGLDETAAMEDGPTIAGGARETGESYPEDDAVILDGDDPGPEPDPALDYEGWPDVDGAAEAHDRRFDSDDDDGATPTPGPDPAGAAATADGRSDDGGVTATAARPTADADASDAAASGSMLTCPACGYGVARGETAHRPGDNCPECSRAYLDGE
jgi:hypothetical protein